MKWLYLKEKCRNRAAPAKQNTRTPPTPASLELGISMSGSFNPPPVLS